MKSLVLLAVVASAATLYGASPDSFGAQPASTLAPGSGT
jgi:hypothetical protein